jgi:hypothetical protein
MSKVFSFDARVHDWEAAVNALNIDQRGRERHITEDCSSIIELSS